MYKCSVQEEMVLSNLRCKFLPFVRVILDATGFVWTCMFPEGLRWNGGLQHLLFLLHSYRARLVPLAILIQSPPKRAGEGTQIGQSVMTWAPWKVLHNWAPFKIDALGLVTLLGAEEVNSAVGRLVRSTYLEYLPLLGAFVIAGNRFTEKAAGFNLYNISKGIHTTDLSAWLTRWILSQDFEVTRSFVVWKVTPARRSRWDIATATGISFVLTGFLMALTVLSNDWYGFANAIAMVISILVRSYVIGQQRAAIDAMVDGVVTNPDQSKAAGSYEVGSLKYNSRNKENEATRRKSSQGSGAVALADADSSVHTAPSVVKPVNGMAFSQLDESAQQEQTQARPSKPNPKKSMYEDGAWMGNPAKVLIVQSDSKAVTFWMPRELLIPPSLFIEGPCLLHPRTYFYVRSFGWLAFGVHIVAIGMADLASQLYTVILLVLPTVLLVLKFGCDDSNWKPTMDSWRRRLLSSDRHHDWRKSDGADESGKAGEFLKQRECWIGSRLKAEIYEWPVSYEFTEEEDGEEKKWTNHVPRGKERSRKRQDLYAWLALTRDEEESMDKWDLFPHDRDHNQRWWKTYKLKRDGLQCNPDLGPQRLDAGDRESGCETQGHAEPDVARRHSDCHRHGLMASPITSSAFPAFSDHPVPVIGPEEVGLADHGSRCRNTTRPGG